MDLPSTIALFVLLGLILFAGWAVYKLQKTRAELLDAQWEAASHASLSKAELTRRKEAESILAERLKREYLEALEAAKAADAVKAAELLKKATAPKGMNRKPKK